MRFHDLAHGKHSVTPFPRARKPFGLGNVWVHGATFQMFLQTAVDVEQALTQVTGAVGAALAVALEGGAVGKRSGTHITHVVLLLAMDHRHVLLLVGLGPEASPAIVAQKALPFLHACLLGLRGVLVLQVPRQVVRAHGGVVAQRTAQLLLLALLPSLTVAVLLREVQNHGCAG